MFTFVTQVVGLFYFLLIIALWIFINPYICCEKKKNQLQY